MSDMRSTGGNGEWTAYCARCGKEITDPGECKAIRWGGVIGQHTTYYHAGCEEHDWPHQIDDTLGWNREVFMNDVEWAAWQREHRRYSDRIRSWYIGALEVVVEFGPPGAAGLSRARKIVRQEMAKDLVEEGQTNDVVT